MVNWLDGLDAYAQQMRRRHPEMFQDQQDDRGAPITPLMPLPDANPMRGGFRNGTETIPLDPSQTPLQGPDTSTPTPGGSDWTPTTPDKTPLDPGWADEWRKAWQQQDQQQQIPPPPAGTRRVEANAGQGLLGLGQSLMGGGGSGLLGNAGSDTLGSGMPLDPSNPLSMMNPNPQTPGFDPSSAMSLLGSSASDYGGGGGDDSLGTSAAAAPADDGSNPGFFNRLFGGSGRDTLGRRDAGLALMQLGGGIAAGATEGWGAGIGKGLQGAGASLQRSRELADAAKERQQALAEKIREHKEEMDIERAKLAHEKNPAGVQEYQFAVDQGYKGDYLQFQRDKAGSGSLSSAGKMADDMGITDPVERQQFIKNYAMKAGVYIDQGGNKYGPPPKDSAYVYEKDPDNPGQDRIKMEQAPGEPEGTMRPATVPLAGSDLEKEVKGRARLGQTLIGVGKNYKALDDMGAITNIHRTPGQNIGAAAQSSEAGQVGGKILGTEAQSVRNRINAQRASIIAAIKDIAHMGATQMNSNVELQFYLNMATNPDADYHSNLAALDILDKQYMGDQDLLHKMGIPEQDIALARDASQVVEERGQRLAAEKGGGSAAKESTPQPKSWDGDQTEWDNLSERGKELWHKLHGD